MTNGDGKSQVACLGSCSVTVMPGGEIVHEPDCLWVRHEALLDLVAMIPFDKLRSMAIHRGLSGTKVRLDDLEKFLNSERQK